MIEGAVNAHLEAFVTIPLLGPSGQAVSDVKGIRSVKPALVWRLPVLSQRSARW